MTRDLTWMGVPPRHWPISELTAGAVRAAVLFVANPPPDAPIFDQAGALFYLGERGRELGLDVDAILREV